MQQTNFTFYRGSNESIYIRLSVNKRKDDGGWENTPPPLYSPATISPMVRPARQGLLADSPVTSHRPVFTINKKLSSGSVGLGKLERKSDAESDLGLDGVGSSLRAKVEEYDDEDYYDDFEVVEKGKRRSDGYGDDGNDVAVVLVDDDVDVVHVDTDVGVVIVRDNVDVVVILVDADVKVCSCSCRCCFLCSCSC